MSIHPASRHLIKLTTHPDNFGVDPEPLQWDARDPVVRGPVVATVSKPGKRNAIGAHGGTYSVYRAVALAAQAAPPNFRPDFTNTLPPEQIGPHEPWFVPGKICSLDPWGHVLQHVFEDRIRSGDLDVRPTIAVTKSHLDVLEVKEAIKMGKLEADGKIVSADGSLVTTKAAIEPVWHLEHVAKRFRCEEAELRRLLYEQTGGMFPELITRSDLKLFLPPINGMTVYIIGDVESLSDDSKPLVVRLQCDRRGLELQPDESYDSDIFATAASSCRTALVHGMMECVVAAQQGGAGLIVYSRQEGNALGEVAKFLVHNARDQLGDSVDNFFSQQKRVSGADDVRLYELSADVLLWLGITRVHKLVTSNDIKVRVLREAGIEVVETVATPQTLLTKMTGEGARIETAARATAIDDPKRSPRLQIAAMEALDLSSTEPAVKIGPFPAWSDPDKIVALDPWGHLATQAAPHGPASEARRRGVAVQPTIAVSRANLKPIEIEQAVAAGRLQVDGKILKEGFVVSVVKCAIEPVWYLPGIARRFKLEEATLRRMLFEHTGGMFPELVTRSDLSVFLPPIGGCTAYIMGDPASIPDPSKPLAVRVHDECNGSDVFGSDICTCRPYLVQGIEECILAAQQGGAGLIVYNRKEGRALGEVTKFMVYNARKRQEGGDSAQNYFKRTEMIAGVQDMRFQELMPDALLWLGVRKIDRFISMSDMKYDALASVGIEVVTRVDIPEHLIPADAKVEIDAKVYAGYFAGNKKVKTWDELQSTVGRPNDDNLRVEKIAKIN